MEFLRKYFDTSKRDVENVLPMISQVNGLEPEFQALSDEDLHNAALHLRGRARDGESTDSLMPEVFACVREVSLRTLGMRQFDVQLIGGSVLHQGRIAEMRTGEGKTLVAAAPLVLNALGGNGAHLVTVNDYLARRDAVWMGPIYHFMGLTVGIIQGQSEDSDELGGSYLYQPGAEHPDPRYMHLVPCSRRDAYSCDIVYGTNHEFGFDYLRDNMAHSEQDLVMRELHYAIIDEVDSILIDEARTPHIISGPSNDDVSIYNEVNKVVKVLTPELHYTSDRKSHVANLTEEGMDEVEQLLHIDNIASNPKLFHHVVASVKAHALFDKDVHYVVRGNEVVIVDENTGRMMFGRRFSDGLHQALEAKEGVTVQRESQTVATITFQNLFRLYEKLSGMTGTAKTEEDEFRKIYGLDVVSIPTNKPMARIDNEDIIYKSSEAKFRGISMEILRLFAKQQPCLAGTRSIDMTEQVSKWLQSEHLQRTLICTRLRDMADVEKTLKSHKNEAAEFYKKPIEEINRQDLNAFLTTINLSPDVLKGDWIDWFINRNDLKPESREFLEEALSHGVPHNVLNAKFHEREALIIAEAGRKGAVTVATNMAGRGVDILLGGRVEDATVTSARAGVQDVSDSDESLKDEYAETYATYRRGGKERAAPPLPLDDQERKGLADEVRALGGLYILGTERHESRRIDNQLRGRAGRQGDPGESQFFVALDDTLWKIFNANMLDNPLLKAWPDMEEVNAKFLSKMILRTQERIENHFFESRKNVLEYDDVLNAQREDVYAMRREILLGKNCREDIRGHVPELMMGIVDNAWVIDENENREYDYELLFEDLNEIFPMVDYATLAELEALEPGPDLADFVVQKALLAYDARIEKFGDEAMADLERQVFLYSVNERWMDHLQTIDYIKDGIGLRGYGQVDPLVAYKRETYDLFLETRKAIFQEAVRLIYRAQMQEQPRPTYEVYDLPSAEEYEVDGERTKLAQISPAGTGTALKEIDLTAIDWKKVGRNDVCPCGSGKKFKSCHYPQLRSENII